MNDAKPTSPNAPTDALLNRDLLRGSLDLMVLAVLAEGRSYGYEIQQTLRRTSGNLVRLQAGTLYPILHRLEAESAIRARWEAKTGRKRKWYELTAAGRRRLRHEASQWQQFRTCMEQLVHAGLTAIDPA